MFGVWRCPSLFVRALVRGMSEAGRYCAKRDSPDTMRCSSACGARAVALPSRASRAARPASARGDARSRAVSSRPSQHARDASATGCPLSSTRVAHRGRGLAPAHALPDHISGLGYVPPGRAADPASVPTLAVSQLAASGKGAPRRSPPPPPPPPSPSGVGPSSPRWASPPSRPSARAAPRSSSSWLPRSAPRSPPPRLPSAPRRTRSAPWRRSRS